ncbi:MAG: 4Fe-4S binding protein [Spirochaetaceae bacterium]|jgi:dissimilatory sulfite reductase (desulfoviridin) alpha/beta subunit|nr:4Fe-4S binding protein [Spirochaetaceae bacterium]
METDYAALKKGGFMRQIQQDKFSLRLRVAGGQLGADQLRKVAEVADRFGRGYAHLTSRQGVEIPFLALADLEAVKTALAEAGLTPGACGPRVRTVTACQGRGVCPNGLIETSDLAKELDARYFGLDLPHKFKIGLTGCLNNCLKAEENDLGLKGVMVPAWQGELCGFCGVCESVCPRGALAQAQDGRGLSLNEEKCNWCGRCIRSCPENAWTGRSGYFLFFGGTFGSEIRSGTPGLPVLFDRAEVFRAADGVLKYYQDRGKKGERFFRTLARRGFRDFTDFMQTQAGF